ncbi:Cro/CI family transcriptional regulator [Acetobacter thailandicus]|uniref:Cro/CI family transcriptional regulator n=1 Tax=Acetobacter thailandicus TaxID=1502842 RepID=UPI0038D13D3A
MCDPYAHFILTYFVILMHIVDMNIQAIIKEIGGPSHVARLLGISHSTVLRWKRIPDNRIIAFEAATGVPRELLRPDLFIRKSVKTRGKK